MISSQGILSLLIVLGFQFSDVITWNYEHVSDWTTEYPICGSETQSPIDLIPDSIIWNTTISEFQFSGYDSVLNFTEFNLTNNGHSVQMNVGDTSNGSTGTPFVISGGGLPSNFTLAQFHFHWGKRNDEGSEHTVQEASYPMELHLVHWDSINQPSFGVAANKTEGLAVLGIFVQIGDRNNSVFDNLIKYFQNITYKDGVANQVPQFPLNQLLPNNIKDFYRYRGSLTTPPCYNSVIWTVFVHPITISESQLQEFRTRLFEESYNETPRSPLVDNFRATQPVHSRNVYKTFEKVKWSYNGETDGANKWKDFFPKCNGEFQSPINISTTEVIKDNNVQELVFGNYNKIPSATTFNLVNTGTSVDLTIGGDKSLKISGGGLAGAYILEKITFHWGENNGIGSDHRVNDLSYPLEVQFLHYSSKYASIAEASSHIDGLAILAVFFQGDPEDNTNLKPVLSELNNIHLPGNNKSISTFPLDTWIPANFMSFYRYSGSLTVPNCAETVTWIVFTEPLPVSAKQLDTLRNMLSATADGLTPLKNNFRPTQALSGRTVTRSVPKQTTSEASTRTLWSMSTLLVCFIALVVHTSH